MTEAQIDRNRTRDSRTRTLGTAMYVLIAGTLLHHAAAIAQAPVDKAQLQDIVPAAAINLAFFGFLLWVAREARNGRRLYLATVATLGFSAMMLGGFAYAHHVIGFTGATWLIPVQVALALVALAASIIAIRACAT